MLASRVPMAPPSSESTHTNGMQTIGTQIGSRVRAVANYGRPTIEINLNNNDTRSAHGAFVTSYSTMDTVEGTVSVTAAHETRFETVEIAFTGTSQVYVDRLTTTPSISGRTEATHRFLTLKQPIDEATLPQPRILAAGKTYTFPFTFTIPSQLLPRACPHKVDSDHVRQMHLMLPPSLGDPELAGHSGALLDDLAPEMSKTIYGVKVRVTQLRESDGTISVLSDKMKKVRVKPAFEEQPPLNTDAFDPEYRLRQEKKIKKGLFKGKLGTLTAQSCQPKPLVIPGARSSSNPPVTTIAKVVLRFDPADENNTPPRLGSLGSKIKVSTFYASAPRHNFPARASLGIDLTQGAYQETIPLSSLCVASAQWRKHSASDNPSRENSISRRDSGVSDCSLLADDQLHTGILTPSKAYAGKSFYTAQILVPITLPMNKNFIPTFHSCLISRVYHLHLHLSAQAAGVSDPSLTLKLPVQICADGSASGNANARARTEEAVAAREADDMFTPRSASAPIARDELPPEYAAFAPRARSVTTRVSVVA